MRPAADWERQTGPVTSALRLAVAAVIVFLLARSARVAWRNRDFAVMVWRRIRLRHLAGSVLLLAVMLGVIVALAELFPITTYGLGSLIGLTGNAVFAPVEEAAARGAAVAGPSSVWAPRLITAGMVAFLAALLMLFPWLAYVEEQVFREGLESASLPRRAWAALRFGLTHLVMLVPVAAALAIAVAGFWYGHVYVRAHAAAAPAVVADEGLAAARDEALLASTVWHTTANSLIVVGAILAILSGRW